MYNRIKVELKGAMKNKDIDKRDSLKMVIDKAKTIVKEANPSDDGQNIPDEIIIQAVQKEIKQLNQTKDSLKGKESSGLYASTQKKIDILSAYLPKMMTQEEVEQAVNEILSKGEYDNFGMKMKAVMAELKGKADNKVIKAVVEQFK